jgi:hypothetical protein
LTKRVSSFHQSARDGRQLWCKSCRKVYDAEYWRQNRERRKVQRVARRREFAVWLRSMKAGRPCADCGQAFDPEAMHWDHIPGKDKVCNIADLSMGHRSREFALQEISKCELVCANCHALRTVRRRAGRGAAW